MPAEVESRRPDARNLWDWGRLSVLGIFFLCVILLFPDYGVTNDEDAHRIYGNAILVRYWSFFQDEMALGIGNMGHYGGFFDVVAQLVVNLALFAGYDGIFEIRHLVNALFGLLGLVYTGRLARLLGGQRCAFLAVVFLALTPRYFGHSFNNPKDIPFAALLVAALFYLILMFRDSPRPAWRTTLAFAFFLGTALAVRVGALVLVPCAVTLFSGYFYFSRSWNLGDLRTLVGRLVVAGLLAWGLMVFFWPAAQVDPLRPFVSMRVMSRFPWDRVTFFNGLDYAAGNLPWYYLPLWLGITVPEFYFVAAFAGIILLRRRERWLPGHEVFARGLPVIAVALVILLPFAFAILARPVLYDGIRHFLFFWPPLAICCAFVLDRFFAVCAGSRVRRLITGLLLFSGGFTAFDLLDLHPYQTAYFNRLIAGGLPYASRKFETDYYGNGYREAVAWVQDAYRDRSPAKPLLVSSCGGMMQVEYDLNRANFIQDEKELLRRMFGTQKGPLEKFLFRDSASPFRNFDMDEIEHPDVFLAPTRFHCHRKVRGEILHTIERKGVPLLYVMRPYSLPTAQMKQMIYFTPWVVSAP